MAIGSESFNAHVLHRETYLADEKTILLDFEKSVACICALIVISPKMKNGVITLINDTVNSQKKQLAKKQVDDCLKKNKRESR